MVNQEKINTLIQFLNEIDYELNKETHEAYSEKSIKIDEIINLLNQLLINSENYYKLPELSDFFDENFYFAECGNCGWYGSSKLLNGGGQIADTGDYFDCYCPKCDSLDIDNEININEFIDKEIEKLNDYQKEFNRRYRLKYYSPKNTTIPKEKWGVHASHCCKYHGCKYGDDDCPVYIGLVEMKYKCEVCDT